MGEEMFKIINERSIYLDYEECEKSLFFFYASIMPIKFQ